MRISLSKELHKNQIALHIFGERACFSVPYSGYNCFSYPLPTGSAARGMLDNIYAHPHNLKDKAGNNAYQQNFKWVIDKIFILNPITYYSFGINGRQDVGSSPTQPQQHTILLDVAYVIIGHPHLLSKPSPGDVEKHISIFNRRCKAKSAYIPPHLGFVKYPARYNLAPEEFETFDINMVVSGYLKDMVYDDSKGISETGPEAKFIPMLEIKHGVAILN